MPNGYTVAAYFYPGYHPDKKNDKWHGKGWTEWELHKRAEPRFKGHYIGQPLWGYEDESDPKAHEKKLKAASDHGVDVILYDWYWYDDGLFIEKALEKGYLKAKDRHDVKFAVMWAGHTWFHPNPFLRVCSFLNHMPGSIKPKTFVEATDYCIKKYLSHPNYWRLNGKLYFSIFDLPTLSAKFGGIKGTRKAFDGFRKRVRAAGLGELHLNLIDIALERVIKGKVTLTKKERYVKAIGFDSLGDYGWTINVPLNRGNITEYPVYRKQVVKYYEKLLRNSKVPFIPNVAMGWDVSSRCAQSDTYENLHFYPFNSILRGNSPAEFKKALKEMKGLVGRKANQDKVLTINAWNEWTEGSYLEPDKKNKFAYLKAVKEVFKDR